MEVFRLFCRHFWVDVRARPVDGAWVASADTPASPTLATGLTAFEAITDALEYFTGVRDQLLSQLPETLLHA